MERIAFVMRVRAGYEDEYERRHQNLWPAVADEMRRSGIHKMSIFRRAHQLFLYMEVEDYAESVRILEASPVAVRWERYMAPIMESAEGENYDPENAYPDGLPEVFHWDA